MRKLKLLSVILVVGALIIGGCGKNPADGTKEDPTISTEAENAGGSIEHGEGYGFTELDLDLEVDEKDAIEIDYDGTKTADAEYKNTFQNIDLKGQKAMDEMHKLFIEARITKDMPKDQVIDEILKYYNLDHYSKLELDIEFDEGTTMQINDVK